MSTISALERASSRAYNQTTNWLTGVRDGKAANAGVPNPAGAVARSLNKTVELLRELQKGRANLTLTSRVGQDIDR